MKTSKVNNTNKAKKTNKAGKTINCYGASDMGRNRTNNEDAYVVEKLTDKVILAVVIDGVGGYEGGEVAADIAKNEIHDYLGKFDRGERIELLKQAVASANNAIFERRKVDEVRSNMSCVLTASIIDVENNTVNMVHVGDTRMYQYHHGELKKLSHDHSLVGYREEIGDLTEEEAMHHPQRNVIGRDVGSAHHDIGDPDFIEANQFPLLPNSTYLLCSDGLTDLVTSKQISEILEKKTTVAKKAQDLIDAANDAGGKDNITVVLVEYKAGDSETRQDPVKASQPIVETIEERTEVKDKTQEKKPKGKKSKVMALVTIALCLSVLASVTYYVIDNYILNSDNSNQQIAKAEVNQQQQPLPETDIQSAMAYSESEKLMEESPQTVKESFNLSEGISVCDNDIISFKIIKAIDEKKFEVLILSEENKTEEIKGILTIE